jgi:CHAT domain
MARRIKDYFVRDFERFSLSTTVREAYERLIAWNGRYYGVVQDNTGTIRTLVDITVLSQWPDNQTLRAMQDEWPLLYEWPEAKVDSITTIADLFKFAPLGNTYASGIVLVDKRKQPVVLLVLTRDLLAMSEIGVRDFLEATMPKLASPFDFGLGAEKDVSRGGSFGLPEPERDVTRYGQLQFPAQVPLYVPTPLTITINREQLPGVPDQVRLDLKERKWPLKVIATLISVQPEDFLIQGASYGIIEVPEMADSAPLTFTLIPQSTGKKDIHILFEQMSDRQPDYIVTTCLHTEVIPSLQATPAGNAEIRHAPKLSGPGDPPDVTIYIKHTTGLHYDIYVRTAEDKPDSQLRLIDQLEFPQPPDEYLKTLFEDLDRKTGGGISNKEFDAEVKKIGNNLYNKLFHEEGFKRFYWEYMEALPDDATVQIISDEPYIPWELLRPFRQRLDGRWVSGDYLSQRFALSRWLSGPQRGSKLPLLRVVLVEPPSDLEWVEEEVQTIKEIPGLSVRVIREKEALEEFFQTGEADVVHFACHGAFQADNPARSVLLLGDHMLCPDDVIAENCNFGRVQPLVFLNACDSGRQGIGLTGLDGWAQAFIHAGVGFFVGSMWKTTDQLAYEFAKAFYQRLQAGDCVAEAMRRARKDIVMSGDATYLSYTLYAHPRIRARSM